MAGEALVFGVCTASVAAGAVGLVAGIRGRVPEEKGQARLGRGAGRGGKAPRSEDEIRRRRVRWIVSAAAGIAVWAFTGWLLAVPLIMLVVLGWPWLMAPTRSDSSGIDRLDALADWTRRIADLVELGAGLENAVITSLGTCPAAIRPEVADLVSRLQARWRPVDALRLFADRFGDATSDKIAAALILRADERGPGLALALRDFAATVRDEVRQRRGIEADRASARAAVRWITYLILGVGGMMALNRDYSEPYGSFLGQIALAVLAAGFIGVLLWMRAITAYKSTPRFLTADPRSVVKPKDAAPQGSSIGGTR